MKYTGIGIDLGTTNCVVTYVDDNGKVCKVPNKDGYDITPSSIYVSESGEVDKKTGKPKIKYTVGQKAKNLLLSEPTNVISSFKPYMGTKHVLKDLHGRAFTAQHCSMLLLKYLKDSAEKYLNESIEKAVITVPAYFTENQKSATITAAKLAGLKVLELLPEPASSAYYLAKAKPSANEDDSIVLVYDIGGGTFDTSLVLVAKTNTVLDISGDHYLGGDDIDKIILETTFPGNTSDLSQDEYEQALKIAELGKIEICDIYNAYKGNGKQRYPSKPTTLLYSSINEKYENVRMTYKTFITAITPLIDKTIDIVVDLVKRSGLEVSDIKEVLLVGGTSRIPLISERLKELGSWDVIDNRVDPDYAVGMGAGIYLRSILDKKTDLINVTPSPIGIELDDGSMKVLLEASRQIPCSASDYFAPVRPGEKMILNVYEGFGKTAKDNQCIGQLILEPQSQSNFSMNVRVDKSGTLHVKMIDDATNKVTTIPIIREYSQDEADIEQLSANSTIDDSLLKEAATNGKLEGEQIIWNK